MYIAFNIFFTRVKLCNHIVINVYYIIISANIKLNIHILYGASKKKYRIYYNPIQYANKMRYKYVTLYKCIYVYII